MADNVQTAVVDTAAPVVEAPVVVQDAPVVDTMATAAEFQAALQPMPWRVSATPHQLAVLYQAYLADGMELGEWTEGLDTFPTADAVLVEWGAAQSSTVQGMADKLAELAAKAEAAVTTPAAVVEAAVEAAMAAVDVEAPVAVEQAVDAAEAKRRQAERDAAEREAAEDEAVAVLKAVVKAYRGGEKAYRGGLLLSGMYAADYIARRLALGASRDAAVQAVEGQLAMYASSPPDANRLVRCYVAHKLLAVDAGLAPELGTKGNDTTADVPYGHYRDAYCRLVERVKAPKGESWVLLPGLEAECRTLYTEATSAGLDRQAVSDRVGDLCRTHSKRQSDATAAAAKAATAEADRTAVERKAAAAATAAAAETARKAEAAVKDAADAATRAVLTAAMEADKAALLSRQRAEAAVSAAAAEAARAKATADKAATEAAKRETAAADKARKAAEAEATKAATKALRDKAPTPESRAGVNILAAAKAGTAKDVAGMVVELVLGCDAPDDVLEAAMSLLAVAPTLTRRGQRACQAALVTLRRPTTPAAAPTTMPMPTAPAAAPTTPAAV